MAFVLNPFDQQQLHWQLKYPNKVGVITLAFVSLRLGPKDFGLQSYLGYLLLKSSAWSFKPNFDFLKWDLMVWLLKKEKQPFKMSGIFSQLRLSFNLIMGVIMAAGGSTGFGATCWHANVEPSLTQFPVGFPNWFCLQNQFASFPSVLVFDLLKENNVRKNYFNNNNFMYPPETLPQLFRKIWFLSNVFQHISISVEFSSRQNFETIKVTIKSYVL